MTIIRFLRRSINLVRPSLTTFEICTQYHAQRSVSILAWNLWQNSDFSVIANQEPKIPFLLTGQFVRHKFKKSNQQDEDQEDFDSVEDLEKKFGSDKHSKVMKVFVNSLRADLILKSGLGIARNKVETLFYESKIRVNGKKIDKKSSRVDIGDEIDVVKGTSQMNPDHLVVQRVEILNVRPNDDEDGLVVSLRRCKSLIIDNYEDPYRGGHE